METDAIGAAIPVQAASQAGSVQPQAPAQGAAQAQAAQQTQATAQTQTVAQTNASSATEESYYSIVAKVNQELQLTGAELDILKQRSPALYAQALQASAARQQLRSAMEASPAHAAQTAREAIAEVSRAAERDENLVATHRALNDEYQRFVTQYDQVDIRPYP